MGYRIEYDGQAEKYEVRSGENVMPVVLAAGIIFLAAAFCFCPQIAEGIRGFLIPGEDAVTVQAFHNMADDLRSGAKAGEALEAFCRFILHGK